MQSNPSNLISVTQAAKELGLTPARVRQMCNRGEIPSAFRLGNSWAIPRAAVERLKFRPRPGRPKKS